METKFYSCKDREELNKAIEFEGNYFEDKNMIIDVIGIVDRNEPEFDGEGNLIGKEPDLSDFLFNVLFKTEEKKELFELFKQENPETPVRRFL